MQSAAPPVFTPLCDMVARRSAASSTSTQPPTQRPFRPKRAYFLYLNERGHLYNLFNVTAASIVKRSSEHPPRDARRQSGSWVPPPPPLWARAESQVTGPCHIMDTAYLSFFFRHLRLTPTQGVDLGEAVRQEVEGRVLGGMDLPASLPLPTAAAAAAPVVPIGLAETFPFVSMCGQEANFLATEDAPIVYDELMTTSTGNELNGGGNHHHASPEASSSLDVSTPPHYLTLARGALQEAFDPSLLWERDGRLYYPVGRSDPRLNFAQQVAATSQRHQRGDSHSDRQTQNQLSSFQQRYVLSAPTSHEKSSQAPLVGQPLGLLSAAIGLQLGFDCIDEVLASSTPPPATPTDAEGGGVGTTSATTCCRGRASATTVNYTIRWSGRIMDIPTLPPV